MISLTINSRISIDIAGDNLVGTLMIWLSVAFTDFNERVAILFAVAEFLILSKSMVSPFSAFFKTAKRKSLNAR